ncbi:hypothetical protein B0O80DRAFT_487864 [Mortierella sp. GBAus27b]|nr:hypothetical protein B0O80DRAFT_487864 [Mortierella sp. GBAus27b]
MRWRASMTPIWYAKHLTLLGPFFMSRITRHSSKQLNGRARAFTDHPRRRILNFSCNHQVHSIAHPPCHDTTASSSDDSEYDSRTRQHGNPTSNLSLRWSFEPSESQQRRRISQSSTCNCNLGNLTFGALHMSLMLVSSSLLGTLQVLIKNASKLSDILCQLSCRDHK